MKITLTNVMLGVHRLSLYNKLPSAQFRFFMGLLFKANDLGFKKTIELNISDAMGVGGGNSRQSVNQLRQGLCEFRVNGDPILEVEHGSNFKNISAKYEINYSLLIQNGSPWNESVPSPSRDASKKNDGDGTVSMTDVLTSPRSDQKRGETSSLVKLMQEKWPHPNPPSGVTVGRMIDKFGLSVCVDAMDATPDDMANSKWSSIYSYMRQVAEGLMPTPKPPEQSEEDKVIKHMIQIVMDYRTLDPETGLSSRANRLGFLVNSIRNYEKWYDVIDNFGTIVGMELDEYQTLMNGGAK